ncbi:hypothetical protein [Anaerorhabdus sp.]|uniref:hypothetical protein n=1 Tax=Anaerorhabdus sp. TaxID=1872524 RepID=UPI002FC998E9
MRKIGIWCLTLILLTGCGQANQKISNDQISILKEAIVATQELQNYTKNEDLVMKVFMDEEITLHSTTKIETRINNVNEKAEGYLNMNVSVEGVGEGDIQLWAKNNQFYIESDGQRAIQEGTMEDFGQQLVENDFSKMIESFDYINGRVKTNGNKMTISTQLDELQILQLLQSQGETYDEIKLNIKTNRVDFVISDNKYLTEIHFDVLVDIIEEETTISNEIVMNMIVSDMNTTEIVFPDDLADFGNKQATNQTNQNKLMKQLIDGAGYEEVEPGVIEYDWGTERYQFDFNRLDFNLITKSGTYTYNWNEELGTFGGVCTYNFAQSENIGCNEEEVANIQLAKELFDSECQYSGVSPSSLN